MESKVTLKRHPEDYGDVRHWEPSTYRLLMAGAFYRLEPFGNHQYEKILGTGDNEVKTLLRFSSVEEHRQWTKIIESGNSFGDLPIAPVKFPRKLARFSLYR